jgi:hypothetical protein
MNLSQKLPDELVKLTNSERIALIREFPVGDVVSPPGHTELRHPEAIPGMSKLIKSGDAKKLGGEPILLNLFATVKDRSPVSLTVHCVDGTHRLVAGFESLAWQVIGDIPTDMIEVWVEGWANGDATGPRPRWIPKEVVEASNISDWQDVSSHPMARGPSAQIRGDIANDSVLIPYRFRGMRISQLGGSTGPPTGGPGPER